MEEAFRAGKLKINENKGGGSVPLIQVQNDGDRPVFLQAGETVKGGQQDRIIASDAVVPPGHQGPIAVYCVEQSRWSGSRAFIRDDTMLFIAPTRGLKYFVQHKVGSQQGRVWTEVDEAKQKAVEALSLESSRTSSLNEELRKVLTSERFVASVAEVLATPVPTDAVGAIFVIKGKVAHFDRYATHDLFVQQFPKLVNSAVFEALLESRERADEIDETALRDWVRSALSILEPKKARVAYSGCLPQFESIDAKKKRSVFGYRAGNEWLHVQGIRYAGREE